VKNIWNKSCR